MIRNTLQQWAEAHQDSWLVCRAPDAIWNWAFQVTPETDARHTLTCCNREADEALSEWYRLTQQAKDAERRFLRAVASGQTCLRKLAELAKEKR